MNISIAVLRMFCDLRIIAGLLVCGFISVGQAIAQDTIKIGIVGPRTGPLAEQGEGYAQGIDAFFARYGTTVVGKKIEVLFRDNAGTDASRAKQLTEELVVKDRVSFLGGYPLTPDATSSAPVINEAKVPTLLFSAATPALINVSPYFIRSGQSLAPMGRLSAAYARKMGKSRGCTTVADYATGHIAEELFAKKFIELGGQMVCKDRFPANTVDFAPLVERIIAANADAVYMFVPAGAPALGMLKAMGARGLLQKILVLGLSEAEDNYLKLMDDTVIGHTSVLTVVNSINNPENDWLKDYFSKKYGSTDALNSFSVGAYDGMRIIYKMIENTSGKLDDPDAAIKSVIGLKLASPRGPVTVGEDRELIQNFYVRRVEKGSDGIKHNVVIDTFHDVDSQGVPNQGQPKP